MSWTIRTPNGATGSGVSSFSIPLPTGVQANDLLVSIVSVDPGLSTYTVTPPSGWTLIDNDDTGAPRSYFYYKIAGASESNPTWTVSSSVTYAASIIAVAGVNPSAPLDVHATSSESSTTATHTTPSITPSQNNSLLVAAIAINTASVGPGTLTTNAPFTQQDSQATIATTSAWEGIATDIQTTAASISATFMSTTNTVGSKFIAAFAPTTITTSARTVAATAGFQATNARTVAPTTGLKATNPRTVAPSAGLKATVARALSASALLQSVRTLVSSIGLSGAPNRQIVPSLLLTYHTLTPLHGATITNGGNDASGMNASAAVTNDDATSASLAGPVQAVLTGSGGTKARLS